MILSVSQLYEVCQQANNNGTSNGNYKDAIITAGKTYLFERREILWSDRIAKSLAMAMNKENV